MKKLFLAAAILAFSFVSKAQDTDPVPQKKINDRDEIIIKKKDLGKDGKVTIEIKDQQVIIDGKPIKDYDGNEFVIKQRHINTYDLSSPESPFRLDNNWSTEDDNDMDSGPEGERAFLGVMSEPTDDGAKIMEVTEKSAAEKAGLKKGDVITKLNRQTISDHEQLTAAIAIMKPKDKITITYKRDGKENKTDAILGGRKITRTRTIYSHGPNQFNQRDMNMPPMNFNFAEPDINILLHGRPRLGIKAQDTEEGKGVKVIGVEEDSPAGKAGIKENDIITSFDGRDVNSADDLSKASRESMDKSTLKVQVKRNGKSQSLDIRVPKKLKTADL
ncbi:MAG: PDZ domain-containing protein [Flavitalea sp.]